MKKTYGFTITYTDGTSEHVTTTKTDDGWITRAVPTDDSVFYLNSKTPERWGDGAENGMKITYGEIKRLAEEWNVPVEDLMKEVTD